jgi:hypothetical protein
LGEVDKLDRSEIEPEAIADHIQNFLKSLCPLATGGKERLYCKAETNILK